MLFTSGSFVVLVLVTFTLFYLPILRRLQTPILILASLVFYSLNTLSLRYGVGLVFLLLASITINTVTSYGAFTSASLGRARGWLVAGIVANLGILGFFKYSLLLAKAFALAAGGQAGVPHFLLMVTLPIGISFFTFEGISLLVDSFHARGAKSFFGNARGNARQHLLSTTLFVSFFPHLVAGPILKAHDFFPQIAPKFLRDIDWEFCFRRLVMGYFLKMVLADNLKDYTYWIEYPFFLRCSSAELLALLFGFSMQIFADFAGYSLIAIGVAGLFGYRFPENFDFPYIAQSFSEFWRRWHISLSSWLREYLYFPLGGNRKGALRTYFNLFVVMFLGGLWHGAAVRFAVWGTTHGLALAIERLLTRDRKDTGRASLPWQVFKTLLVFGVVTLAWLLFKLNSFHYVLQYLAAIFTSTHRPLPLSVVYNVLFFSAPVVLYHAAYLLRNTRLASASLWAKPAALGAMIFLIILNSGSSGEFIYFQF